MMHTTRRAGASPVCWRATSMLLVMSTIETLAADGDTISVPTRDLAQIAEAHALRAGLDLLITIEPVPGPATSHTQGATAPP